MRELTTLEIALEAKLKHTMEMLDDVYKELDGLKRAYEDKCTDFNVVSNKNSFLFEENERLHDKLNRLDVARLNMLDLVQRMDEDTNPKTR